MKVKVIREYSGEEGTNVDRNVPAGTELTVTRARGNALHANGLVEIIEDEADPEEEEVTQPEPKAITSPQNKAITTPQNKSAAPASNAPAAAAPAA